MKFKFFLYLLFSVCTLSAQQSIRIRDLEKERMATLAEIEETNRLLKENTLTISNALNRLNLLIQQINSRKRIIQLLNQEIASIDEEIYFKETQIKTLEKDLNTKKRIMPHLYGKCIRIKTSRIIYCLSFLPLILRSRFIGYFI